MSDNQPPQGPPPGWQPPQGQSPYGPPPGSYSGPGQPPYGGPPNYGPGGSGDGGNGKKLALLIGGGVLAVIVLIAAVVVGVTQLGGDDDDKAGGDDPTTSKTDDGDDDGDDGGDKKGASGVMSSSGSDQLRKDLEGKGWKCYDSLSKPATVKRCFLYKPDGDSHTEGLVTIQYEDEDEVGLVRASVESPTTAQSQILGEVAGLIGDSMLDKSGSELQEVAKDTSSSSKEIKGARVSGSDGYLYIYAEDYNFKQPEEAPFPAVKDTQAGMTSQGLTCKTESSTLQCESEKGGLNLRAYSGLRDGKSSGGWSVSASPTFGQTGGDVKTAAKAIADLLLAAKLTDDKGAAFIQANPTDGQAGDFAGYNVEMRENSSGDYFSLSVSVRPIR